VDDTQSYAVLAGVGVHDALVAVSTTVASADRLVVVRTEGTTDARRSSPVIQLALLARRTVEADARIYTKQRQHFFIPTLLNADIREDVLSPSWTEYANRPRPLQASYNHSKYKMYLLGRPEPPFRTGLCFTRDVSSFSRHAFSEVPRPIALKLCHMVGIWLSFIIPVQKLGEALPKKIRGQKPAKFFITSDLIANISGTAQDIQNRKTIQTMAIPPAFDEKRPVNLGPLTARKYMGVWTH